MLEELKIGKEIGLKLNLKKTQVMINSLADLGEDITLEGTPLEKVEKYTYLGQITPMNSNKENEIKRRIYSWVGKPLEELVQYLKSKCQSH